MAGWGSGFLASWAIWGMRWVLFAGVLFAGRTVTVLAVTALVATVLVMTALVARPGTGC